jgi:hypothetical protein
VFHEKSSICQPLQYRQLASNALISNPQQTPQSQIIKQNPYEFKMKNLLVAIFITIFTPHAEGGNALVEIDFREFSLRIVDVGEFREGLATVTAQDREGRRRWGIINQKGEVVVFPSYARIWDYSEGLAAACKGKIGVDYSCGYIDRIGKQVIDVKDGNPGSFKEGLAHVYGVGYRGKIWNRIIDKQGKVVFEFGDEMGLTIDAHFGDGLLGLRTQNGGLAFFDRNGVPKLRWEKISSIHQYIEGLARVMKIGAESVEYVDKSGRRAINEDYKHAGDFHEGLAWVMTHDGKQYYINKFGERIIGQVPGRKFGQYGEDLFSVGFQSSDGIKWGYIDRSGNIAIQSKYLAAGRFSNSLAAVKEEDAEGIVWAYIDKTGRPIIRIR